tara:strand:+ start:13222 stop:13881 length:660 start_codon:yes stop_codon:yes gene_type:complete
MDLIKAKPISEIKRLVPSNVYNQMKAGVFRGEPPSNLDNARYVLCSNKTQMRDDTAPLNAYIQIATSDLALPTAQAKITIKTNTTTFVVSSLSDTTDPSSPPYFPDGTSQLNQIIRRGVGAVTDANGNNITVAAWSRTAANSYNMTTSAPITFGVGKTLWFGNPTGRIKSSVLLPVNEELIVEKETTDLIFGSNGISGNQSSTESGRIDFTRVERIKVD